MISTKIIIPKKISQIIVFFQEKRTFYFNSFYFFFFRWLSIHHSHPPLYLKKNEVSLTIFYNTILLRTKRACVFYLWSFFNFICEFNRNVSFVCCGKIVKNKFLVKFLPNNPEIFEENYVLLSGIRFWEEVMFKQTN